VKDVARVLRLDGAICLIHKPEKDGYQFCAVYPTQGGSSGCSMRSLSEAGRWCLHQAAVYRAQERRRTLSTRAIRALLDSLMR